MTKLAKALGTIVDVLYPGRLTIWLKFQGIKKSSQAALTKKRIWSGYKKILSFDVLPYL